ncbi:MAG: hypothetical protein VXW58_11900 [Pseudomonadota bacterium]|nr:hypothetical protein [Pseudomonadota bacterium]
MTTDQATPPDQTSDQTPDARPGLVLWCADTEAAAPLASALARVHAITRADSLPQALPAGDAPFLMLYVSPARALAAAMTGESTPAQALAAWCRDAEAMLALHKAGRRRVRLIETGAARRHPRAFCDLFALSGPAPAPEAEIARPNDPEAMFLRLLARRMLLGDAPARALLARLEAVSVPLGDETPPPEDDPEAVLRAFRALRGAEERGETLTAQNRAMRDELTTLAARIDDRDAALEAARADLAEAEAATEMVQTQSRYMQDELERLARQRDDLAREAERLPGLTRQIAERDRSLAAVETLVATQEVQAAHVAAELGAQLAREQAEAATLRERLSGTEAELAARRDEIDRFFNSRSYRLTAPLRWLFAVFSGRGAR